MFAEPLMVSLLDLIDFNLGVRWDDVSVQIAHQKAYQILAGGGVNLLPGEGFCAKSQRFFIGIGRPANLARGIQVQPAVGNRERIANLRRDFRGLRSNLAAIRYAGTDHRNLRGGWCYLGACHLARRARWLDCTAPAERYWSVTMTTKTPLRINRCTCPICRSPADHPEKALHEQINLLMSVMNTRQRRLFAEFQAQQMGHGGITRMAEIRGVDRKTIHKGMQEIRAID